MKSIFFLNFILKDRVLYVVQDGLQFIKSGLSLPLPPQSWDKKYAKEDEHQSESNWFPFTWFPMNGNK